MGRACRGIGIVREMAALLFQAQKDLVRRGLEAIQRAADEQIDINSDELKISGKTVTVRRYLYIMLNKPSGVLSAAKDLSLIHI